VPPRHKRGSSWRGKRKVSTTILMSMHPWSSTRCAKNVYTKWCTSIVSPLSQIISESLSQQTSILTPIDTSSLTISSVTFTTRWQLETKTHQIKIWNKLKIKDNLAKCNQLQQDALAPQKAPPTWAALWKINGSNWLQNMRLKIVSKSLRQTWDVYRKTVSRPEMYATTIKW
jgi:hypothetical protein